MKTFRIDDKVVYRTKGVCVIVDIVKKTFSGTEEKEYYVCESIDAGHYRSYVPTDSETAAQMKRVPEPGQIDAIICAAAAREPAYIEDRKQRETYYAEAEKRGDETELLCIYGMLEKRRAASAKTPASDIRMMAYIERAIGEEFSVGLGIPRSEVRAYIRSRSDK